MSDQNKAKSSFSLADLGALRLLIVSFGIILAGFAFISGGDTAIILIAIGLTVAVVGVSVSAIALMRHQKATKEKDA